MTHKIVTHKSKLWAVVWCLLLGGLGVHRFYLNHIGLGFMWIALSVVALLAGVPLLVTGLLVVDAIYLLCKGKAYYRRVKEVELAA
jgi:TM2 domain-containing membrane protein YozV